MVESLGMFDLNFQILNGGRLMNNGKVKAIGLFWSLFDELVLQGPSSIKYVFSVECPRVATVLPVVCVMPCPEVLAHIAIIWLTQRFLWGFFNHACIT